MHVGFDIDSGMPSDTASGRAQNAVDMHIREQDPASGLALLMTSGRPIILPATNIAPAAHLSRPSA